MVAFGAKQGASTLGALTPVIRVMYGDFDTASHRVLLEGFSMIKNVTQDEIHPTCDQHGGGKQQGRHGL